MFSAIPISKLNDFLYSPKSVYFHTVYEDFSEAVYHSLYQTRGRISHQNIDSKKYSGQKAWIQAIYVYSHQYGLVGKIDLYNSRSKILVERKYQIKKIYKGYVYQLWAQMFCLQEMGYEVKALFLHSQKDNKRYPINKPNKQEQNEFANLIQKIQNYNVSKEYTNWQTDPMDQKTIYKSLYF